MEALSLKILYFISRETVLLWHYLDGEAGATFAAAALEEITAGLGRFTFEKAVRPRALALLRLIRSLCAHERNYTYFLGFLKFF